MAFDPSQNGDEIFLTNVKVFVFGFLCGVMFGYAWCWIALTGN